jgi:arginine exporter protein ArgO
MAAVTAMAGAGSDAFVAGVLAGIGVALPLGAIGVLIVSEGLHRGFRPAAAAATGVAAVDLGYASVAVVAGTAITAALDGRTVLVRLGGAVVLVAVAVRGIASLRPPSRSRSPSPSGSGSGSGVGAAPGSESRPGSDPAGAGPGIARSHLFWRFVALTAINPLTAIYFVVLTAGLGDVVSGRAAGARFVLGVGLASWTWQLVLAAAGALAGARLPGWARTATGVVGYLVVLGYAARLALSA